MTEKLVRIYMYIKLVSIFYICFNFRSKSSENQNEINSNQVEIPFTNDEYVNNIDKSANSENSKLINLFLFIN